MALFFNRLSKGTSSVSLNIRTLRRPAGTGATAGRRFRANWPAELRAGSERLVCTVLDISVSGACVRLDQALPKRAQLWLIVEKMPPIPAVVAWRKGAHVGLSFQKDQSWVLESYQQHFDPAAWLKK